MFKEFLQHLFERYKQSQQWLERHRRWRQFIVGIVLVGLALVFGVTLRQQWQQLDDYAFRMMRWQWLGLAVLLYPFSMAIQMWTWHQMVAKFAQYDSLRENLIVYNMVNLAKSLPGLAFHVAGRLMLYEQRDVPTRAIIKAIAIEAALHPLVGLLCFAIVSLIRTSLPIAFIVLGIILLGLITVATIRWVDKHHVPAIDILKWGGLAWLTWLNGLFFLWAILRALPTELTLSMLEIWYLWLIGGMINYLATYLLGGLNILREITLSGLLAAYIPLPLAIMVVIWIRLIGLVSEIGWSALLLMILRGRDVFGTLIFTTQKES